jgi:hypothetical protein
MGVVFRRNFPPLGETALLTREDWAAVGRLARERIIRRTVQGLDVDGNAFAPYSEGYAKQREKANVASARVTLQLSGEMLRSIEVLADDDGVELTFL